MKPRLLIFTNRLIVGGISNDIIPLAWYLKNDFDILIIYGEKEKGEIEADFLLNQYPGLNVKKISAFKKTINPFKDITAYRQIRKTIRSFGCDIMHTHGAKSGFLGKLAAYHEGVQCIVHTFHGHHFHSYYNSFFSKAIIRLHRRMARLSSAIVAISKQQWHDLVLKYKIASADKIKIIRLGLDPNQFKPNIAGVESFRQKYKLNNVIAIGLIARITKIKNFDLFIEVVSKTMRVANRPVKFFVIGDGVLKKNIQIKLSQHNISWCNADNYNDDSNVVFTSWIQHIADIMHTLDIVMLTSNNEGSGLSLIEAQFCGKPVVTTDVGGIQDSVINNKTGFLTDAGNADAMVEKLKLLIEDDGLRKTMGENAAIFAAENFSKQAEVENYKQLYKQLLVQSDMKFSKHQHLVIK